ncbi:MAG: nuclear transport factor 2 family protein [Candidatus Acidiferrales bacterium]|jgi:3-phenylpropionate/cinnamic acid dioxygenase small subunit
MRLLEILRRRQVTSIALLLWAACFLSPTATRAQQAVQSDSATAARIQRLEDIEEIRVLLTNYGRLLDAHDLAGYSHLFAEDGEWVGGFGSATGPAAIQALMVKNLGASPSGKPGSTYHLLTNFIIDVHGDTGTAWSRWSFVVTGADNRPTILYGGHYDDTLVRENGHWKFKRRVAVNDIPHAAPTDSK